MPLFFLSGSISVLLRKSVLWKLEVGHLQAQVVLEHACSLIWAHFKHLHRFPGRFYATHPSEAAVDSMFRRAQSTALADNSRNLQRQTHVSCWVDLVCWSNGGHASSKYQTSENRGVISIKSVSFRFCVMLELKQCIKKTGGRHRRKAPGRQRGKMSAGWRLRIPGRLFQSFFSFFPDGGHNDTAFRFTMALRNILSNIFTLSHLNIYQFHYLFWSYVKISDTKNSK